MFSVYEFKHQIGHKWEEKQWPQYLWYVDVIYIPKSNVKIINIFFSSFSETDFFYIIISHRYKNMHRTTHFILPMVFAIYMTWETEILNFSFLFFLLFAVRYIMISIIVNIIPSEYVIYLHNWWKLNNLHLNFVSGLIF